jgi:hypothetical protein
VQVSPSPLPLIVSLITGMLLLRPLLSHLCHSGLAPKALSQNGNGVSSSPFSSVL